MVNQEIIDYVKKQLDTGVSREDISRTLINNGWSAADIGLAFDFYDKANGVAASQSPREEVGQFSQIDSEFNKKGKFGKSLLLVKASFRVLKMDKEIMLFPILSGLASLFV